MHNERGKILWIDDEIDHLKPHILFLEEKGYKISISDNGKNGVNISATQLSKTSGISTVTIYSHFPNLQVDLSLSILNYLLDLALHHYNVNLMNNLN